ncbi:MAG: BlaI/MecI/CopY family transcriptional regulator [Planctomycetota bacterium]|jgi:predicted transcriptional regulator
MTERLGSITETEFEVLKVLWEHGPGTVRQVNERLSQWAYTTVQTLLTRLEKKGYVACDRSGFAHVFEPAVTRDSLLRCRLGELVEQLSDGAATPLVLALVEDHRFTAEEIEQFRRLLDRLEVARPSEALKRRRKRGRRESS